MHDQLIEETGGSKGMKDEGILDSSWQLPFKALTVKIFFHQFSRKRPDSRMG